MKKLFKGVGAQTLKVLQRGHNVFNLAYCFFSKNQTYNRLVFLLPSYDVIMGYAGVCVPILYVFLYQISHGCNNLSQPGMNQEVLTVPTSPNT